jgi:hypothetical protein
MSFPAFRCHASDRFLRIITGIGVAALLAVGVFRAATFLVYAMLEVPAPDQPFHLEGVSVYFAWCVQHSLTVYPAGIGTSYAVNYMGPFYFWTVGVLGWLLNADIPALYIIGRVVTFICGLGPAAIAAVYLYRRYGRLAGLVGFVFGLGSGTMIGYGVMSRPDMMADLLGAAGFFLACRRDRRWLATAALLLALACLTKQTAAVWLLAAAIAMLTPEVAWRRALTLIGITTAMVLAVVTLLAVTVEPYMIRSLLGQGAIAFDAEQRSGILMLLLHRSPELLFFALLGCGLWMSREHKNHAMLILTVVWLIAAVFLCAKKGSDVNYFIPLRIVEAIAAGTFCAAALRSNRPRLVWTLAALVGALVTLPSANLALETTTAAIARHAAFDSQAGQARLQQFERCRKLAQDANVRLLTDSDRLAVYQGPRAAWMDTYLFRLRVDSGRLDPHDLIARLQARWFQYVVLTVDLSGDYGDSFFYRLPAEVAAAIRANYRLQSRSAGLFVYVPRQP